MRVSSWKGFAVGITLMAGVSGKGFLNREAFNRKNYGYPAAPNAEDWKKRRIYQVLTDRFGRVYASGGTESTVHCASLSDYCGGNFKGLIENLDYIQDMGFDAIWISPVLHNSKKGYHGYWTQDFYKINDHFGNAADLKDLRQALTAKNMWLMIDIVMNHVAPEIPLDDTDLHFVQDRIAKPFNDTDMYHKRSLVGDLTTYDNLNPRNLKDLEKLQQGWLAGNLPDLNQDNSKTRTALLEWLQDFMTEYQPDGLRLDACLHVKQGFWREVSATANVFTMCEVLNGDAVVTAGFHRSGLGGSVDSTLNYPLYYLLQEYFGPDAKPMRTTLPEKVKQITDAYRWGNANDIHALGNFVDNHDQKRFLSLDFNNRTQAEHRFKNAFAFSFLFPGIPIMYYGNEWAFSGGEDPGNREDMWPVLDALKRGRDPTAESVMEKSIVDMRPFIKILNKAHSHYIGSQAEIPEYVERYKSDHVYCFSRGKLMGCFSNSESSAEKITLDSYPFLYGAQLYNILEPSSAKFCNAGNWARKVFPDNGWLSSSSHDIDSLTVTLSPGEVAWFVDKDDTFVSSNRGELNFPHCSE